MSLRTRWVWEQFLYFKQGQLETWQFIQARQIREEERGEADGEETPDPEKTAAQKKDGEVNSEGDGENTVTEGDVVSKIADLAV